MYKTYNIMVWILLVHAVLGLIYGLYLIVMCTCIWGRKEFSTQAIIWITTVLCVLRLFFSADYFSGWEYAHWLDQKKWYVIATIYNIETNIGCVAFYVSIIFTLKYDLSSRMLQPLLKKISVNMAYKEEE